MKKTVVAVTLVIGMSGGSVEAGTITGRVAAASARVKDARNVVVYIDTIEGKTFPPPTEPAVIDQRSKTFVPRVVPILKGGSVTFRNSDALLHNVHTYQGRKSLFNLATPPDAKPLTKTFLEPGEITVLCDVHPEMAAFILVLETPYWAVTGEDGRYQIADVPSGTYTLKSWHETLKSIAHTVSLQEGQTVTVDLELE